MGVCGLPPPDCGDAMCGADEDCSTCPADCGQCCGNGTCEGVQSENCATCPADCACAEGERCDAEAQICAAVCEPTCGDRVCGDDGCGGECGACADGTVCSAGQCVPPEGVCGDATCDASEDCSTCAQDCACPDGQNCVTGTCEAPEQGAPQFLTLNTNVRRITVGDELVFSTVVTDPDGIDDLIGGVLEDPNGQSYGAFISSGQEGAYSMTITWGAIHLLSPISFVNDADRTFVAVFFDQGGLRTRQEIVVTLHCNGDAACDGVCTDLDASEAHCGACDAQCDDNATCDAGSCACNGGFFGCENETCVAERLVCNRADECGDGSDEAGCCFANDECALGSLCEANRCAPGCDNNARCPANLQCRGGACVPNCQRDADCENAEYCGADGRCAVGCRDDASCAQSQICEARACIRGCRDNGDCGNGASCVDQLCSIFTFEGIRQGVPDESLIGWRTCHSDLYNGRAAQVADIVADCDGEFVMYGCREVGEANWQLLAMGEHGEVFRDTGNRNQNVNSHNGVDWYFSGDTSMGFTGAGAGVTRNSCDTMVEDGAQRLCWHTEDGHIKGGYRCGARLALNSSAAWERSIWTSGGAPIEPEFACEGYVDVVRIGDDGGQFEVDTRGAPNRIEATCGGGLQGEVPIVVNLSRQALITIETVGGGFDTVLYSRAGCALGDAELVCDDDSGAGNLSLISVRRDPGPQVFFVDGYGEGPRGTTQVLVTVE